MLFSTPLRLRLDPRSVERTRERGVAPAAQKPTAPRTATKQKAAPLILDAQQLKRLRRWQAAHDFNQWLMHLYPAAFIGTPSERIPLAIGIHDQLIAIYGRSHPGFCGECRYALHVYTSHPSYLKRMRAGALRTNLDGTLSGTVTEEQAAFAQTRINKAKAQFDTMRDYAKAAKRMARTEELPP